MGGDVVCAVLADHHRLIGVAIAREIGCDRLAWHSAVERSQLRIASREAQPAAALRLPLQRLSLSSTGVEQHFGVV